MLNGLQSARAVGYFKTADLLIFTVSGKSVSAVLTGMEPTGTGETKSFIIYTSLTPVSLLY